MRTNFHCRTRREEALNPGFERHEPHELGFCLSSSGGEGRGEEALRMPKTSVGWQAQISTTLNRDHSLLTSAATISNAPGL
jgi:hypothetical protein